MACNKDVILGGCAGRIDVYKGYSRLCGRRADVHDPEILFQIYFQNVHIIVQDIQLFGVGTTSKHKVFIFIVPALLTHPFSNFLHKSILFSTTQWMSWHSTRITITQTRTRQWHLPTCKSSSSFWVLLHLAKGKTITTPTQLPTQLCWTQTPLLPWWVITHLLPCLHYQHCHQVKHPVTFWMRLAITTDQNPMGRSPCHGESQPLDTIWTSCLLIKVVLQTLKISVTMDGAGYLPI